MSGDLASPFVFVAVAKGLVHSSVSGIVVTGLKELVIGLGKILC